MDFQLEDKQDAEIEKLKYYHEICNNALNEFSNNHPYQLAAYKKRKSIIRKLLPSAFRRGVGGEVLSFVNYKKYSINLLHAKTQICRFQT